MKKIGIFTKRNAPEALDAAKELLESLDKEKVEVLPEKDLALSLKIKGYPGNKIPSMSDIIIVFGGDGTLLSVARLVGNQGAPILGVNFGGLGFITEVTRNEIKKGIIEKIFSKKYHIDERLVLSTDIYRSGKKVVNNTALNDVVISKSALARMIDLDMHVNKNYVSSFKADGLIISTPTGSTAHSLSAGGPILYPSLESFVITPICPHTLANRPIVLPDNFMIEVSIKNGEDVYLTLDGQVGFPLDVKDRIRISKADFKTKFIRLYDRDYFQILRTKLKWGE